MNEILTKINFDSFIILYNDMTYFIDSINEKFFHFMKNNFQSEICDIFEDEYRELNLRVNLWRK